MCSISLVLVIFKIFAYSPNSCGAGPLAFKPAQVENTPYAKIPYQGTSFKPPIG